MNDSIEGLSIKLEQQIVENDDLKFSLQLNKQSLQAMLLESQRAVTKEASLIETINIISKDNGLIKEQIESLRERLKSKNLKLVDQEVQVGCETVAAET